MESLCIQSDFFSSILNSRGQGPVINPRDLGRVPKQLLERSGDLGNEVYIPLPNAVTGLFSCHPIIHFFYFQFPDVVPPPSASLSHLFGRELSTDLFAPLPHPQ
jgi:hypothetical protein